VDSGVDTGPVLAQREIAIPAGITESELHEQIKAIERSLIVEVVSEIAEGKLNLSERAI
jgi:phosphoribosylglycinamide formyltransferase-1